MFLETHREHPPGDFAVEPAGRETAPQGTMTPDGRRRPHRPVVVSTGRRVAVKQAEACGWRTEASPG